jgi:hypothetical protein
MIFGACWAAAGIIASASAAKPKANLRDFIKIAPQTYVFFGETMSQNDRQHNRKQNFTPSRKMR